MAKAKTKVQYVCSDCGGSSIKWQGKCPHCGAWNTMKEFRIPAGGAAERFGSDRHLAQGLVQSCEVVDLSEVDASELPRIPTGFEEFDRVMGGGLVPGGVSLIGGDPGIGKSTLLLQVMSRLVAQGRSALYVSGEESAGQVAMRAKRLGIAPEGLKLMSEIELEKIEKALLEDAPEFIVIDSIQTLFSSALESAPGSVTQVRECSARLTRLAKSANVTLFFVGHVTKDGSLAGPRVLEHIVDTVLQFEGDQQYMYRILRAQKNRFGSTSEIGIYEMRQEGLREVTNPSELLLSTAREGLSGIAIAAAVEGVRPFLIEVQALVSSAAYGTPQRSSTGFDGRRLNMLLAVLEKRVGFKLLQKDVFLNIAGGLKVQDPAIDLAVLAAVLSSNMDIALDASTCLCGEVGLAGEIRSVNRIEQRIAEAQKLGFKRILIPAEHKIDTKRFTIEVVGVKKVTDAFRLLIKG